jgi:hypothetical protein
MRIRAFMRSGGPDEIYSIYPIHGEPYAWDDPILARL